MLFIRLSICWWWMFRRSSWAAWTRSYTLQGRFLRVATDLAGIAQACRMVFNFKILINSPAAIGPSVIVQKIKRSTTAARDRLTWGCWISLRYFSPVIVTATLINSVRPLTILPAQNIALLPAKGGPCWSCAS